MYILNGRVTAGAIFRMQKKVTGFRILLEHSLH